jgi:TetR/AcrR family transcriptional regulator, cholesterol catabolism regulator
MGSRSTATNTFGVSRLGTLGETPAPSASPASANQLMAADPAVAQRPRLGRPRKRPVRVAISPREQILDAAAGLFEAQGFSSTTTRQIANASGLEQGSLFHYFQRKDQILAELLDRTLDPALAYTSWLDRQAAPPPEKLFLLAYRDTLNICSGHHNVAGLMHLPEAKREDFAPYWRKRLRLKSAYGRYVAAGSADGSFAGFAPAFATEIVFAMIEGTIEWFVRRRDDPDATARDVASAALTVVLRDRSHLSAIVKRALARTELGPDVLVMAARRR